MFNSKSTIFHRYKVNLDATHFKNQIPYDQTMRNTVAKTGCSTENSIRTLTQYHNFNNGRSVMVIISTKSFFISIKYIKLPLGFDI